MMQFLSKMWYHEESRYIISAVLHSGTASAITTTRTPDRSYVEQTVTWNTYYGCNNRGTYTYRAPSYNYHVREIPGRTTTSGGTSISLLDITYSTTSDTPTKKMVLVFLTDEGAIEAKNIMLGKRINVGEWMGMYWINEIGYYTGPTALGLAILCVLPIIALKLIFD